MSPWRRWSLDDRGGIELFVLVTAMVMLVALGLVVDGGGYLRTKDRAGWCAQQAARAGGQQIDLAQAAAGNAPVMVASSAVQAAEQTAAVQGMTATVVLDGDGNITVTCDTSYTPVLLSVAGRPAWSASGEATARPVHGVREPRP